MGMFAARDARDLVNPELINALAKWAHPIPSPIDYGDIDSDIENQNVT